MSDAPQFFTPTQWRAWLVANHASATECLVGFVKVTTGDAAMSWSESVDEALCFGWIDGVRRGIDDRSYSIRFTPRKAASNWSAINVKKMAALEAAGRMTDAGRVAFANRSESRTAIYSYEVEARELTPAEQAAFDADRGAAAFFAAQAAWYRRTATHWVTNAKRADTRKRRLDQLIADSSAGRRLRHLSR